MIRVDYTGPGTLVLPLGTAESAPVKHVKSGEHFDLDDKAWEAAQKLPNVKGLIKSKQIRVGRPV